MKKFSLVLGLLAMASVLFAQVEVIQSNELGSNVEATVTQSGTNKADVTQSNVFNSNYVNDIKSEVDQTNTGGAINTVTVEQDVSDVDDPFGSVLSTKATQVGMGNDILQQQKNDGNRGTNDFVSRTFVADQDGERNQISQESLDGDQGSVLFDAEQDGNDNVARQVTNNAGGSMYAGASTVAAEGTITQDGNRNNASQTMQSLDAMGDIDQTGDDNVATQVFGNLTRENHADIDQKGNNNEAHQTFTSGDQTKVSWLTSDQSSDGNYSEQVVTVGNNNVGFVQQIGVAGAMKLVDGNEAYQTFTGESNFAEIIQDGYELKGTQFLDGDDDDALINQVGHTNEATQTFVGTSHDNTGDVYQSHKNNVASQLFEGNTNYALINQHGKNGTANQSVLDAASTGNNLEIMQELGGIWGSRENVANQVVTGNNNDAYIYQKTIFEEQSATQTITGNANDADIFQDQSTLGWNTAEQTIVGDENEVFIDQNFAGGNSATQSITGTDNYASIVQWGKSNTAEQVVLAGSGNSAKAVQHLNGANNNIYMSQDGMNNVAAVEQSGCGSDANILQEGEGNLVDGLVGAEYAVNNCGSMLDIDQVGNDNEAHVSQTYHNSSAIINQSGIGNIATVDQH